MRALSESCSDLARDTAQKPVVNLDLIHQQNAVVIGTQIVVHRAARTRRTSVTPPRQTATGKPWRERPYRTGAGPPRARGDGVVHATDCLSTPTPWLRHGRHRAPPDRDDATTTRCACLEFARCRSRSRERFTEVARVVKANGRGTTYGAPGLSPLSALTVSDLGDAYQGGELQILMGEFSDFDAAPSALHLVAETRGLG